MFRNRAAKRSAPHSSKSPNPRPNPPSLPTSLRDGEELAFGSRPPALILTATCDRSSSAPEMSRDSCATPDGAGERSETPPDFTSSLVLDSPAIEPCGADSGSDGRRTSAPLCSPVPEDSAPSVRRAPGGSASRSQLRCSRGSNASGGGGSHSSSPPRLSLDVLGGPRRPSIIRTQNSFGSLSDELSERSFSYAALQADAPAQPPQAPPASTRHRSSTPRWEVVREAVWDVGEVGSPAPPVRKITSVLPRLIVGSAAAARCVDELRTMGVTHVLNCCTLPNAWAGESGAPSVMQLGLKDAAIDKPKLHGAFAAGVTFIASALLQGEGKVLIHCRRGVSRSCSLAMAYLIHDHDLSVESAFALVRKARPKCDPNLTYMCALNEWAAACAEKAKQDGGENGGARHGGANGGSCGANGGGGANGGSSGANGGSSGANGGGGGANGGGGGANGEGAQANAIAMMN